MRSNERQIVNSTKGVANQGNWFSSNSFWVTKNTKKTSSSDLPSILIEERIKRKTKTNILYNRRSSSMNERSRRQTKELKLILKIYLVRLFCGRRDYICFFGLKNGFSSFVHNHSHSFITNLEVTLLLVHRFQSASQPAHTQRHAATHRPFRAASMMTGDKDRSHPDRNV